MSKNFNRAKASKCETGREIKLKVIYDDDPYIDECWGVHRTKGERWSKQPNKALYNYQVRQFKSWKHNRKKQYK